MRAHRRLAVRLALLAACSLAWPRGLAAQETGELGALHREILEILHGEPRADVVPSPYYCWRHGRGPQDSKSPAFDWFVAGRGACSAVYAPDLAAVHSPLSDKGEILHFFFDDEKHRRLEAGLTRLATRLERRPPSLADRFDVQMTVWELVAALQFRRDMAVPWYPEISQDRVDRLVVPALRALRATLFSREQVAALPATLGDLAARAGEPAIQPFAERLLAGDDAIVEDRFPSQLHNAFSQGRLFSRVFFTLDDAAERKRFQEYLGKRPNTRLESLGWHPSPAVPEAELTFGDFLDVRYLPLHYAGIRAVLVLFFNVLDSDFQVVPTPMVATWDELWWTRKLEHAEDLRAADRALRLRVVKYQKQLGFGDAGGGAQARRFPLYRSVGEDEVSQVLFTDVNPVAPGTQVTTVRGQCLSCHSTKLMTYDMHRRKVGFVRPFALSAEDLGGREAEAEAGKSFREWTRRYLETPEVDR